MTRRTPLVLVLSVSALGWIGCAKEEPKPEATPAKSASAAPPASSPPPASASAPAASAAASAAPSGPVHACPKDSTGDGTFSKPCEAKGTARMMEVTWTGKTDDQGPHFRVTNKAKETILYGKIAVYFYDKAGKQLEVKDVAASGKMAPFHKCSGNMFGGVMKPGEKAVLTFSCVKKDVVPEGTAAIEAEMAMVGFADSTEKKNEYYWANSDLMPDARKKGGAKK